MWVEHRRRGDERARELYVSGPYPVRVVPEVPKGSKRDKLNAADQAKTDASRNLWRQNADR